MAPLAAIFGCSGTELSADEATFFRAADPWGFILFGRNVDNPEQLRRLTAALRGCVGRDAPVLIDQEGGRVQRLRAPHWREWMPPLVQMQSGLPDAALRMMYLRYRLIAAELRAVGIDVNCAPLGDLARTGTHPVLRNRCYGSDPDMVAATARAVAQGLLAGGVLPVMKHMPGHGRARTDSHVGLPVVTADSEALWDTDFAVFAALADLPVGMTAHVVYECIDADAPATVSAKVISMIRDAIGFGGLLMTDDISMQALSGTVAQRATAALAAGCDLVLHCNGNGSDMEAIAAVTGRLAGTAARRADTALALRSGGAGVPAPRAMAHARGGDDMAALEAELSGLLAQDVPG